jgi:hypothetical protein
MNLSNVTAQQLRNAADLREQIEALQDQLNELLGSEAPAPVQAAVEAPQKPANGRRRKKRKKLSAEGRANIAAAQRARWAARRDEAPAIEAEKPKKKRNISEAGRRAMSLAGKRRWAKARAEKKTEAARKSQVSEAKLKALAKARAARSAKAKAARKAKDDVPF